MMPTFDQILVNLDQAGVIHVAREICNRRGIALEDMWARPGRKAFQSRARFEFWAALKALDPIAWSYPRIADLSGHDHTTVMSGHRKHLMLTFNTLPAGLPVKTEAPAHIATAEEKVA